MNVRNEVVMEYVKNERTYRLCIAAGTSYHDAHEVALYYASCIQQMGRAEEEKLKAAQPVKEGQSTCD